MMMFSKQSDIMLCELIKRVATIEASAIIAAMRTTNTVRHPRKLAPTLKRRSDGMKQTVSCIANAMVPDMLCCHKSYLYLYTPMHKGREREGKKEQKKHNHKKPWKGVVSRTRRF